MNGYFIASSFSPLEIEGQFYRYLRWAPFYHHVEVRVCFSLASPHLQDAHDPFYEINLHFRHSTTSPLPSSLFSFQASKIIFFNTGPAHQLGVHFGALFGLVAVNVVGLTLSVWFERWREDRSERKKLKEESDEK